MAWKYKFGFIEDLVFNQESFDEQLEFLTFMLLLTD